MRRVLTTMVALVALVFAGCVMSPIPEPPQGTIDNIEVYTSTGRSRQGPGISGGPGAVSPAGDLVRVFLLDTEDEPSESAVEEDGSFFMPLALMTGDEFRFQVLSDDSGSEPMDFIVGETTTPLYAPRPLASCLILDPALEVELMTTGSVRVENRCDQEVELLAPTLRRPVPGIDVGTDETWPAIVAPGTSIFVNLQAQPDLDVVDIFFIEAISPERDRRPVTFIPPP